MAEGAGAGMSRGGSGTDDAIIEVLIRLDRLRNRGLTADRIAAEMASTHPEAPGGGSWNEATVVRVLEIVDSVRARSDTREPERTVTVTSPSPPTIPAPRRRAEPSAPVAPVHHGPPRSGSVLATPASPPPDRRDSKTETATSGRARLAAGAVLLAGLGAGAYLGVQALVDARSSPKSDASAPVSTSLPTTSDSAVAATTSSTVPPDPADTLSIRVEPGAAAGDAERELVAATATIRTDGKLYLEGAFASQAAADAFLTAAGGVFGRENIVEEYVVDPAAPAPTVADVALDKPVLFETGTATIHPDYIPFLEACAGVLELNPHIVMSVSAFTDSLGDEDFNLELSRQRAEAILDFYRSRDIGDDQLIGTGYGEAVPVADNETEEGRQQNRRAMLQLLNVMGGTADADQ